MKCVNGKKYYKKVDPLFPAKGFVATRIPNAFLNTFVDIEQKSKKYNWQSS